MTELEYQIAPGYQDAAKVPAQLQPALDRLIALRLLAEDIENARVQAEMVYLVEAKVELDAGRVADVADVYVAAHFTATKGFHGRWEQVTGRTSRGLATRMAHRRRLEIVCAEPNGPGGHYWTGTAPIGPRDPRPPRGKSVVYVLYDAMNEPIYVGSTEKFHTRLTTHIREGKPVVRWMAYPCADREKAYELEQELLDEFKLPLNTSRHASGLRPSPVSA